MSLENVFKNSYLDQKKPSRSHSIRSWVITTLLGIVFAEFFGSGLKMWFIKELTLITLDPMFQFLTHIPGFVIHWGGVVLAGYTIVGVASLVKVTLKYLLKT